MKRKVVLIGGKRPQLRPASGKNWTKARQAEFLSVLAETCNVSKAAKTAGVSITHAYRRRKIDAAFRAGWVESIAIAYHKLEMALLDRAFNGTEKPVVRRDGSEVQMREYSNQLGLALLKMHRETAAEATAELLPDNVEELRACLLRKLRRLKQRRDEDGANGE